MDYEIYNPEPFNKPVVIGSQDLMNMTSDELKLVIDRIVGEEESALKKN